MSEFFSAEGPLIGFLQKLGNLIILSFMFLLCSLPVVTLGTSAAALYYAVAKSIRRERGYPIKEFFRAFRRNLKNGTILTILFGGIAALALYNRELLGQAAAEGTEAIAGGIPEGNLLILYIIYDGILLLLAMIASYVFPVLSRFAMKLADIVKLSFVMSVRYIYYTVLLLAGAGILIYLQWKLLPIPTVFILPGGWTYISSLLIEKVMKKYTPSPKEGEDAWYLE